MKRIIWLLSAILLMVFMVACGSTSDESSSNSADGDDKEVVEGGTIEVAYPTQPQTLDPHGATAEATRDASRLIYEALVTLDEDYQVIPELAESFEVNDDNTEVTFELREGVKFHNGDEMKAEDVVASMGKWSEHKSFLDDHEWEIEDDYNLKLKLEEPSALIMFFLADQGNKAVIMPKDVAEDSDDDEEKGAHEYIGTGPFEFIEWKQDDHIKFEKYEEYSPRTEEASGLGGEKEVLVDEINWSFVPDSSTRVNGLMSGEYDFSHMIDYDAIPQLEGNSDVTVDVWPYGIEGLVFNKKEGLFKEEKARQAVNYALDMDSIMSSAFTGEDYYTLNPSLFLEDQVDWYTDAGKEHFNQKDADKAKDLLDEAGYDGEEIVILTSKDYSHHYNAAVATQQLLEEIGMNVKLDVYDWPTLLERRDDPSAYDMFYTGFSVVSTPHQYVFLDSSTEWAGWTDDEDMDKLLSEIKKSDDQEEAKELYSELQEIYWERVPVINTGENSRVSAYSNNLDGYTEMLGPIFWNVSIKE